MWKVEYINDANGVEVWNRKFLHNYTRTNSYNNFEIMNMKQLFSKSFKLYGTKLLAHI